MDRNNPRTANHRFYPLQFGILSPGPVTRAPRKAQIGARLMGPGLKMPNWRAEFPLLKTAGLCWVKLVGKGRGPG